MNIGIIIYTRSGHTYEVASALMKSLQEDGHQTTLLRLVPDSEKNAPPAPPAPPAPANAPTTTPTNQTDITTIPTTYLAQPSPFDALILGSPIYSFRPAAPMRELIETAADLSATKICTYLTQGINSPAFGGPKAQQDMEDLLQAKAASPTSSHVIYWPSADKDEQILQLIKAVRATLKNK